ncbi:MAG: TatD family hydrolase [Thermoleophilia bacterium]
MIDAHAHLEQCAVPVDEALEHARAAGVGRVVTIGCGPESARVALGIAEREPDVQCALGVHPHQAGELGEDALVEIQRLLAAPRAVAVGEAGLDYFRDYAPRDRQRAMFRAQIALAGEVGKPLVVHTRAADEDTLALLAEARPGLPVVIHCFSSPGMVDACIERGYYASFAGNVTYPKAPELREAAARFPLDRLLSETDSPYLAPQPVRGRPNEPAHVVHVVAELARVRGLSTEQMAAAIDDNATRLLGAP